MGEKELASWMRTYMTFAHFNAEPTLRGVGESLHHFKVANVHAFEIKFHSWKLRSENI